MFQRTELDLIKGDRIRDALVTVRLTSIEHVADRCDEVDRDFDLRLRVMDNIHAIEQYQDNLHILPGQKIPVNNFHFNWEYDDTSCNQIPTLTFLFEASTAVTFNTFVGVTEGSNALSPGVQNFKAPVALEVGSAKSTIVFRGTIHVSCQA